MVLVDYGSGSESGGEDAPPTVEPAPSTRPATKPTLASMLPPPSSSSRGAPGRPRKLQLPALAASTMQAVADLDEAPGAAKDAKLSVDDDEGPARKKPRFGAPSGGGLAAVLPPPKKSSANGLALPPPTRGPSDDAPRPSEPAPTVEEVTAAPAVDFFGLGGFSSAPKAALPPAPVPAPSGVPPPASAPSVAMSSAPTVAEEQPPPPSLLDPYPGYWQRKSGEWVARDSRTDPVWAAFYEDHYAQPPEPQPAGSDGMVEFDAAEEARKARESKPEIIDPREEARQLAEAEAETKPQKQISRVAKGRHQLTSLLSEAQSNRAELEERIARGKLNRRAAGARYGF